jgi:hypothetical protein
MPEAVIPYRLEEYSVPARMLTDDEMDAKAWRVAFVAYSVYSEDPGIWKTFNEYLAFRIGVESLQHVWWEGGREDVERFALLVQKHGRQYN